MILEMVIQPISHRHHRRKPLAQIETATPALALPMGFVVTELVVTIGQRVGWRDLIGDAGDVAVGILAIGKVGQVRAIADTVKAAGNKTPFAAPVARDGKAVAQRLFT